METRTRGTKREVNHTSEVMNKKLSYFTFLPSYGSKRRIKPLLFWHLKISVVFRDALWKVAEKIRNHGHKPLKKVYFVSIWS